MTDELPGAGPELDAMVMEALGLPELNYVEHGSRYLGEPMWALETWLEKHPGWTANIAFPDDEDPDYWVRLWDYVALGDEYGAGNESLPVAICHAILRATREVQS